MVFPSVYKRTYEKIEHLGNKFNGKKAEWSTQKIGLGKEVKKFPTSNSYKF